jgi:hypothetical protein
MLASIVHAAFAHIITAYLVFAVVVCGFACLNLSSDK